MRRGYSSLLSFFGPAWARSRFFIQSLVSPSPALYYGIQRLRRSRHGGLLTNASELVMEGFPRSGNTFAFRAFSATNPNAVIAHHVHSAAQLIRGVALGIPALLLIREPAAAARSLLVRRPELNSKLVIRSYVRFHRPLIPLRDHLVVATFEEVTANFGAVIERVNARFGTSFSTFKHTAENAEAIFTEIERRHLLSFSGQRRLTHVPRPDHEREQLKRQINLGPAGLDLVEATRLYKELAGDAGPATA